MADLKNSGIDIVKITKVDVDKAKRELNADRITVGLATCGLSAGALPVFEALKKSDLDLPVMKTGCIGMCYNEPLVTVIQKGKKIIYGNVTKDNVDILINHIKEGLVYEQLFVANDINELEFYKKQKRLVMENCGTTNPLRLDHYMYMGGYSGLKNALKLTPDKLIAEVLASGLRGRGGAGFPTGKKWGFIAAQKEKKKYLICNGDEGDPGAFMNRTLMESDPFKIIEGMTIGAYATGCDEGIIYTRAEYPLAIETLQNALDTAYKHNLLGDNILGIKDFNFKLYIMQGAGAFVCGEETALINSIEGKRGQPRPRPPFPAVKGLWGKPTNVNNVGTWGHVSTIMKIGVNEYTKYGTKTTKGTKIICLTGKVNRTGVIEVPFGLTLRDLVFSVGGGCTDGTKFKALLSGGPAGGCIVEKDLGTPLDYENISALGSIIGSGGFIVTNDKSCMVNIAKYFMEFTTQESCGKCTPCREGTKRLHEMLVKVSRGNATEADLDKIQELAEFVSDASLCGLGQNAPNPTLSTLQNFRDEYLLHINEKKCPAHVCENLIKYHINETCVGCGACARACPVKCISGKPKELHVIDESKCIKCGKCFEVCHFESVDKVW